jgi:hypothetical protein
MDSKHNHQSKKIKLDKTEAKPAEKPDDKIQSPINYMLLLQNNSKHSYISNEIDYNSIDKVKCTITNSYYLSDLEEYFTYYYLSKKIFNNNSEHNGEIQDLALNLINSRKIFYVTKIYFDYPFNITINIQNNNDNIGNIGNDSQTIDIHRFLLPKFLNTDNQLDEILKNDYKIKYLSIDLYNSIEILNNIDNIDNILFELGKDNLEKSKYTNTKINNQQYTDMFMKIFNILNKIPVKYI